MKSIVAVCVIILLVPFCGYRLRSQDFDIDDEEQENLMGIINIDDSVSRVIDGRKYLYYIKGHIGHIWSLVIPCDDRYIFVAGNTRSNSCSIDTVYVNNKILEWGTDTLESFHNLKSVDIDYYWPFYERLVLFSAENKVVFDCSNMVCYSGVDSMAFNQKLNSLKYLMYWIATPPEVQEKLSSPF
ncbi:MAG: hypothetical protein K2L21_08835 [Muribaculaceae bacterium]|nr:hypothetical protein [Muribaculaceae bacterium]